MCKCAFGWKGKECTQLIECKKCQHGGFLTVQATKENPFVPNQARIDAHKGIPYYLLKNECTCTCTDSRYDGAYCEKKRKCDSKGRRKRKKLPDKGFTMVQDIVCEHGGRPTGNVVDGCGCNCNPKNKKDENGKVGDNYLSGKRCQVPEICTHGAADSNGKPVLCRETNGKPFGFKHNHNCKCKCNNGWGGLSCDVKEACDGSNNGGTHYGPNHKNCENGGTGTGLRPDGCGKCTCPTPLKDEKTGEDTYESTFLGDWCETSLADQLLDFKKADVVWLAADARLSKAKEERKKAKGLPTRTSKSDYRAEIISKDFLKVIALHTPSELEAKKLEMKSSSSFLEMMDLKRSFPRLANAATSTGDWWEGYTVDKDVAARASSQAAESSRLEHQGGENKKKITLERFSTAEARMDGLAELGDLAQEDKVTYDNEPANIVDPKSKFHKIVAAVNSARTEMLGPFTLCRDEESDQITTERECRLAASRIPYKKYIGPKKNAEGIAGCVEDDAEPQKVYWNDLGNGGSLWKKDQSGFCGKNDDFSNIISQGESPMRHPGCRLMCERKEACVAVRWSKRDHRCELLKNGGCRAGDESPRDPSLLWSHAMKSEHANRGAVPHQRPVCYGKVNWVPTLKEQQARKDKLATDKQAAVDKVAETRKTALEKGGALEGVNDKIDAMKIVVKDMSRLTREQAVKEGTREFESEYKLRKARDWVQLALDVVDKDAGRTYETAFHVGQKNSACKDAD
jgi:hypothetical protein